MGCGSSSVVKIKGDNSKEIRKTDNTISNSAASHNESNKVDGLEIKLNEEGNYTDKQCEDEHAEVGKTTADYLSTNSFNEDETASETKLENVNEINENSAEITNEIDTGNHQHYVIKENVNESGELPQNDVVGEPLAADAHCKQLNEEEKRNANAEDQCEDENSEVGKSINKSAAVTLSTYSLKDDEKASETQLEIDNKTDENSEDISKEMNTDHENVLQENEKESGKLSQSDVLGEYSAIDAHARQAPSSVGNSVKDLVNYMLSFSKEPKILARGFFVWIAENIRYDVVGLFNDKKRAPCDTTSVMKNRICVCEGYANVLAALCSHANIPVVKVTGYTKAIRYAINVLPMRMPDHAWNAIQLDGNWYLIDNTWGAGYLDEKRTYNKQMNDFYFLAEPKHLISTHFPFMSSTQCTNIFGPSVDHMMNFERIGEESKRWQLLSEPITVEQFQKNVIYKPAAFKLGVEAISHPHEHIDMENEIEMQFKTTKLEGIILSADILRLEKGDMFVEQQNATFVVPDNNIVKILVHPRAVGYYMLKIFGKLFCDDSKQVPEIMHYYITCTQVREKNFEFPWTLAEAEREKIVLHEPRRGNLIEECTVHFRLSAPYLQRIRVGKTYLNKESELFTGDVTIKSSGQLIVSGSRVHEDHTFAVLYVFKICKKKQQQTRQPIISKNRQNTKRAR